MARQPRTWTISIEQPLGGWAYDLSGSNSAAVQGKKNQYTKSSAISVYRRGRVGHIAPGETYSVLTDASSRVNELALNGIVASNGEVFNVLRNARLIRFGIGDDVIDNHYDISLGGTHAAHSVATTENCDLIAGKDNSGTERIFSTWEDGNDADIQIINPDGSGQDSDWFSTLSGSGVLTKGVPLKLCQGTVDNDLFSTNGEYIAKADLSAGTGNPQALHVGKGWTSSSIVRAGNYIAATSFRTTTFITSFSQSKCRVILWDGFSPNPNFVYDVDDNYVSRINEDLSVITQGKDGTTKVQKFIGAVGEHYRVIFQSAQIGNAPRHGSVDMYDGVRHWGRNGGEGLYVIDGDAFHYRSLVTDGTNQAQDIGMVKNLSTSNLYLGVKTGSSTYKIFKMDTTGYNINADFRSEFYPTPYKSNITGFTFYFSQNGTGASLLASFFKDYNNISVGGAADLLNRTLTNAALGNVPSFYFPHYIYDVNGFYMNLRFNHALISNTAFIIRKVDVHGEEAIEKF